MTVVKFETEEVVIIRELLVSSVESIDEAYLIYKDAGVLKELETERDVLVRLLEKVGS